MHGERWLALIGWHAAALHCAARDRWIGWSSLQRRQRLFLVANQSRFLLLSEAGSSPHLASRVLGLSLRQLPREWQRAALGRIVCGSGTLRWNLLPRRQLARGRRHARLRARARRRDRLSAPRRAQARVRLPAAARRAAATRGRAGAARLAATPTQAHAQRCSMALPALLPRPSPRHAQPPRPALSDAHRAGDPDWIALGRLSDADRAERLRAGAEPADPRRDRFPAAPADRALRGPLHQQLALSAQAHRRRRGGAFAGGLDSRASAGQASG